MLEAAEAIAAREAAMTKALREGERITEVIGRKVRGHAEGARRRDRRRQGRNDAESSDLRLRPLGDDPRPFGAAARATRSASPTRSPGIRRAVSGRRRAWPELVESSYGDVLADPNIDAIVLATPHSQHHAQILRAARAGKHVFVEKPITLTRKTPKRRSAACRAAGVTLGMGFNRRFAPAFAEVVRRVRAGDVGEVVAHRSASVDAGGIRLAPRRVADRSQRGPRRCADATRASICSTA